MSSSDRPTKSPYRIFMYAAMLWKMEELEEEEEDKPYVFFASKI